MTYVRIKSRAELGIKDTAGVQFQRIYASDTPRLGRAGQEVAFLWERRHIQFIRELNPQAAPALVDAILQWLLGPGAILLDDKKDKRPKKTKIRDGFEACFPLIEFGNTYANQIGESGDFIELEGIRYNAPLYTEIYNPVKTPHLVHPIWTTANRFPKVGLVWFPRYSPRGFRAKGRKPMEHIFIEKKSAEVYTGPWPPPLPVQADPPALPRQFDVITTQALIVRQRPDERSNKAIDKQVRPGAVFRVMDLVGGKDGDWYRIPAGYIPVAKTMPA
jgi:hypothetical protein